MLHEWQCAQKLEDILKLENCPLQNLIQPIKTPLASIISNYETLEVLGDSALKYLFSIFAFLSFPDGDEEQLTRVRMTYIKNEFLAKILIHNNIYRYVFYVINKNRNYQQIKNPFQENNFEDNDVFQSIEYHFKQSLSEKQLADIYEACIGLKLKQDYEFWKVYELMKRLNYPFPSLDQCANFNEITFQNLLYNESRTSVLISNLKMYSSLVFYFIRDNINPRNYQLKDAHYPLQDFINKMKVFKEKQITKEILQKDILKYQFNNLQLLDQALNINSHEFQRLEYLGDAALEIFIIANVYESLQFLEGSKQLSSLRNGTTNIRDILNPGLLHISKVYLLGNQFMGVMTLQLQFHKLIQKDIQLETQIEVRYQIILSEALQNQLSNTDLSNCLNLNTLQVTKKLGDIWESVAGAILCDGGWPALMSTYGEFYRSFVKFSCQNILSIENELQLIQCYQHPK